MRKLPNGKKNYLPYTLPSYHKSELLFSRDSGLD